MIILNGLKIRFSKGSAGSSPAARISLRPLGYAWRGQEETVGRRLSGVA